MYTRYEILEDIIEYNNFVGALILRSQGRKARSRQGKGQGNVKGGSRQGQRKVRVRSRQRKHNLNQSYNLIDFDTIEINLV